ncbi:MAG: phospholipase D-like domain-containing protein [Planctomycetota bacterium]|nr:phospholipase D-like domain-containing protein [Planctomycetota bacterium]
MVSPLLAALVLAAPAQDTVRLVESVPLETNLDHADVPQTADVWLELIRGANEEIVLSHFYAATKAGSVLDEVIAALEDAGERGIRVRFLVAETFRETYPLVPAQLSDMANVEVRWIDYGALAGGGVLHAKYMVVDGRETFLGSPNFDFRAMDQIQELGLHLSSPRFARCALDVFEGDWAAAGGEDAPWQRAARGMAPFSMQLIALQAGAADGTTRVTPAFSPRGHLPDGALWDLPQLIRLIDSAEVSVRAQVLTYDAVGYDREYFPDLEHALRAAAARGVRVQLLVADWGKRRGIVEGLQSLACLENLEVRFVVIPDHSAGFEPFSRVAHAKLLVVDEARAWVGSSNWERSYFTTSRNLGAVLEGRAFGTRLAGWFDCTWASDYAEPVDPGKRYEPRRRR